MKQIFTKQQFIFFEKLETLKDILDFYWFKMFWGTWLALQIFHRKSEDFDFITNKNFDPNILAEKISKIIWKIEILQIEKNTLTFSWNWVFISFFWWFTHLTLEKNIKLKNIYLISKRDILAMKISAILNRSTTKDFFDIAYCLKFENFSIKEIIKDFYLKYWKMWENFSLQLILKSLSFTEDAELKNIFILKNTDLFWKNILEKSSEIIINNIKKYL